jgi:hypothetical protein
LRQDREGLKALPEVVKGFAHGLRHRTPLRNARISRVYRHNFFSYASPWWLSRPLGEIVRRAPSPAGGRRELYFEERARYYPDRAATLEF